MVDERAHLAGRTDVEVARLNRLLVRIEVVSDGGEPRGVLDDARVETHRERVTGGGRVWRWCGGAKDGVVVRGVMVWRRSGVMTGAIVAEERGGARGNEEKQNRNRKAGN